MAVPLSTLPPFSIPLCRSSNPFGAAPGPFQNALSAQLSQHWLSCLQGMPEKKRASLDLKPRCPNPDPLGAGNQAENRERDQQDSRMSSQLGPGPIEEPSWPPDLALLSHPHLLKPPPCTGRASPRPRDQSGSFGTSAPGCPHRGPQSQLGGVYDKGAYMGMEPAVVFAEQAGSSVRRGTGAPGGCAPKRRPSAPVRARQRMRLPSCFQRSPPPPGNSEQPPLPGLQAVIYEDGYTYNSNTKHRLVSFFVPYPPRVPFPPPPPNPDLQAEGLGLDLQMPRVT